MLPIHLVSIGESLYVAGESADIWRIFRWSGQDDWLDIGSPIPPATGYHGNPINAMAADSAGRLLIGGLFLEAGNAWSPYLIQANVPGTTLNAQETWRQTHFGTYSNAGNTADTADFDLDGLPNLIEYAFGLNPTQGVSRALPVPQVNGSNYVLSFTQPVGVSGVTYGAEWSTTLAPGSWVSIPNTGTAPHYTFSVPLSGNSQVFVRLKVATP